MSLTRVGIPIVLLGVCFMSVKGGPSSTHCYYYSVVNWASDACPNSGDCPPTGGGHWCSEVFEPRICAGPALTGCAVDVHPYTANSCGVYIDCDDGMPLPDGVGGFYPCLERQITSANVPLPPGCITP